MISVSTDLKGRPTYLNQFKYRKQISLNSDSDKSICKCFQKSKIICDQCNNKLGPRSGFKNHRKNIQMWNIVRKYILSNYN